MHYEFAKEKLVESVMQWRLKLPELELKLAADIKKVEYLQKQTLPC